MALPLDSNLNGTVGLGVCRIHQVNCAPSQRVAFQVTREKTQLHWELLEDRVGLPHTTPGRAPPKPT